MNENDIERQLQETPLAQPSANLDGRMRTLFDDAAFARPHPLRRPVPVWLMAAACVACVAIGFGVRSLFVRRGKPATVVYIFPPSEAMRHLLTGDQSRQHDGIEFSRARVQVITRPSQTPDKLGKEST